MFSPELLKWMKTSLQLSILNTEVSAEESSSVAEAEIIELR